MSASLQRVPPSNKCGPLRTLGAHSSKYRDQCLCFDIMRHNNTENWKNNVRDCVLTFNYIFCSSRSSRILSFVVMKMLWFFWVIVSRCDFFLWIFVGCSGRFWTFFDRFGPLWAAVGLFLIVVGHCGLLWIVRDFFYHCGLLWVIVDCCNSFVVLIRRTFLVASEWNRLNIFRAS